MIVRIRCALGPDDEPDGTAEDTVHPNDVGGSSGQLPSRRSTGALVVSVMSANRAVQAGPVGA